MKSEVTYQKNESSPRRPAGNDFIKWQFPFFCAPFFTFALIWLPTTVRRGIGYLLTRQTLRVAKWIEPPSWTLFYVVLSLALSLSPWVLFLLFFLLLLLLLFHPRSISFQFLLLPSSTFPAANRVCFDLSYLPLSADPPPKRWLLKALATLLCSDVAS